jgi:hypothetical protein
LSLVFFLVGITLQRQKLVHVRQRLGLHAAGESHDQYKRLNFPYKVM